MHYFFQLNYLFSANGYYMFFNIHTIDHPSFETSIIVPNIVPKESRCFSFWYYRNGPVAGNLNIYGTDVNNTEKHLLSVTNNGKLGWDSAFINVPNILNITLRYMFNNKTVEFIAVDDIYISDSACSGMNFLLLC